MITGTSGPSLAARLAPCALALGSATAALAGCDDASSGPGETVDAAPADAASPDAAPADAAVRSYESDIAPIWQLHCMPCHGPDERFDLLRLDIGRENLVEQSSQQVIEWLLVSPGDPEASYLWLKIEGRQDELNTSFPMPPPNLGGTFEPIPASERERIRAWIEAGAGDTW